MDFEPIAEAGTHLKCWTDVSELNYWARRVGFQKLVDYYLVEV